MNDDKVSVKWIAHKDHFSPDLTLHEKWVRRRDEFLFAFENLLDDYDIEFNNAHIQLKKYLLEVYDKFHPIPATNTKIIEY